MIFKKKYYFVSNHVQMTSRNQWSECNLGHNEQGNHKKQLKFYVNLSEKNIVYYKYKVENTNIQN